MTVNFVRFALMAILQNVVGFLGNPAITKHKLYHSGLVLITKLMHNSFIL
jgi:hypothetical protein